MSKQGFARSSPDTDTHCSAALLANGPLGGRMEKRLPIAIVVNLARQQDAGANGTELTYTDNISAHGACVVSSRLWHPGDVAEITSMRDQTSLLGKVIHCHKRDTGRYAIGLKFQDGHTPWTSYLRYNGRDKKQFVSGASVP